MSSFDKIEEQVTLRAPVSRVWQAIASPKEFGRWFDINLDGDFVVGKPITGMFRNLPSEATIMDHQKRLGAASLKSSAAREQHRILHTGAYRTGTVLHLPLDSLRH